MNKWEATKQTTRFENPVSFLVLNVGYCHSRWAGVMEDFKYGSWRNNVLFLPEVRLSICCADCARWESQRRKQASKQAHAPPLLLLCFEWSGIWGQEENPAKYASVCGASVSLSLRFCSFYKTKLVFRLPKQQSAFQVVYDQMLFSYF